jgi:carbamoyltransferase
MAIILGISAYFHDSAAALLVDGKVIAAAQEERFNRVKHSPDFPREALRYCLEEAGITLQDVDEVVFYEKPFIKFERLLETYYLNAPRGLLSFLKAMPQWTQKKLLLRREIFKALREIDPNYSRQKKLLFSSHHLSHAASAFYPSPFNEAAILTIDAVGEWSTATIGRGSENAIEILEEMRFPNSVGLLYSAFTYFLGFKVNSGEYKLMGLAPYGDASHEETQRFIRLIRERLVTVYADGSIRLNQKLFAFEVGLRMVSKRKWEKLFGIPSRTDNEAISQSHCNLAFAIQSVTEDIVYKMAQHARKLTGCKNLCMAGGVALNCVANGKLVDTGIFENIWIQPAAGDAGGALGAALARHHHLTTSYTPKTGGRDGMKGAFLGPAITPSEIEAFCRRSKAVHTHFPSRSTLIRHIVEQLRADKVIAWVQGRMEFGPRALGGRSIIANATSVDMQKRINRLVKFREDFRPFAPVMLRNEAVKYFGFNQEAAYMQYVAEISAEFRNVPDAGYAILPMNEKLAFPRSKFPAISHVDFSSRLQIVEDANHPFYDLLLEMRKQTGDGLLVNTSFNTNGEAIVCSLMEAYNCFCKTDIDILVVDKFVFEKRAE